MHMYAYGAQIPLSPSALTPVRVCIVRVRMRVRVRVCVSVGGQGLHAWLPGMAGVRELLEVVDSGLQINAEEDIVIAGVCFCVEVNVSVCTFINVHVHASVFVISVCAV